jgi:hypothetical protein
MQKHREVHQCENHAKNLPISTKKATITQIIKRKANAVPGMPGRKFSNAATAASSLDRCPLEARNETIVPIVSIRAT